MFYTQYNQPANRTREMTGSETLVTKVAVLSNAERIAQMLLNGQMLEAYKIGYEFGPDDQIPENFRTRPGKGADIVTVMEFMESFGERIRNFAQDLNKSASNAQNGPKVEPEPAQPSNDTVKPETA